MPASEEEVMLKHAAALTISCALAIAQVNTASLTGLVQDPTDAVIAGAKVTARSKATNIERVATTDAIGCYFFPSLPVGEYTITVEHTGFQRISRDLILETAQKARQDFTISVGGVETTTSVEAAASQLSSS